MPTPNHPEYFWYPQNICAYGSNYTQLPTLAWFTYCGFVDAPGVTALTVEGQCATNGAGTQIAEFAICSSPCPPNGAAQILSVLTASGNLSGMTNATVPFTAKTSALTFAVPGGTHLWLGSRTSFSVTQPAFAEGTSKTSLTDILMLDAAAALTSYATIQTAIPSLASVNHAVPYLWLSEV